MRHMRRAGALLLALGLMASPALAQQPSDPSARTRFWTGALLGATGGTAIILGTTALKSAKTTSGNAPEGSYDACVALKSNPVYRGNQCDVLKGPNTAVVIGGAITAATGAALMMLGLSNSSIAVTPGGVSLHHRVRF